MKGHLRKLQTGCRAGGCGSGFQPDGSGGIPAAQSWFVQKAGMAGNEGARSPVAVAELQLPAKAA